MNHKKGAEALATAGRSPTGAFVGPLDRGFGTNVRSVQGLCIGMWPRHKAKLEALRNLSPSASLQNKLAEVHSSDACGRKGFPLSGAGWVQGAMFS